MLRRVVEMGRPKQSSQEELMGVLRRKAWVLLRRIGEVCPEIDAESSSEHSLLRSGGLVDASVSRGGGVAVSQRGIGGRGLFLAQDFYISIESPPLAKLKFCCCC